MFLFRTQFRESWVNTGIKDKLVKFPRRSIIVYFLSLSTKAGLNLSPFDISCSWSPSPALTLPPAKNSTRKERKHWLNILWHCSLKKPLSNSWLAVGIIPLWPHCLSESYTCTCLHIVHIFALCIIRNTVLHRFTHEYSILIRKWHISQAAGRTKNIHYYTVRSAYVWLISGCRNKNDPCFTDNKKILTVIWIVAGWLPEPVFLNVYGAQESIARNEFRQLMLPGGPVR